MILLCHCDDYFIKQRIRIKATSAAWERKKAGSVCLQSTRTITIWLTRMFACRASEVVEVLPDLESELWWGGSFFFLFCFFV